MSEFIVTKAAMRPASSELKCFYCNQDIGEAHKLDCVLVNKKVRIKMTVEYTVDVPSSWDEDMVNFHRNESSWCADNALEELQEYLHAEDWCLCGAANFEFIEDVGEPYLKEKEK